VLVGRDLLTVGETPGASVEQGRLMTDPARGELDMLFQFEHVSLDRGRDKWDPVPLALPALKQNLARWQEGVGDGWNALYWDNHDQPRAVSRFGDDGVHRVASAKTLATVLHLHRGTPFVYQGEELGLPNPRLAGLSDYRDVEALHHYAEAVAEGQAPEAVLAGLQRSSRDNARTPVPWDDGPSAGFTTGTPWMALAPNHVGLDAAAQRDDPDSVLAHYRRLVALRHDVPVVVDGAFALLLPDDLRVWAFRRSDEDAELLVVANCSADAVVPDLPGWSDGTLLLGTHPDAAPALRPWESRVYRTR
jgi:oligo-1,6-glucosidase